MRGTKINIGDRTRVLRYDLNAIAEIGERLDVKVRLSHLQEDLVGFPLPLKALRTIIWAGLIHEDPTITEEEIGAQIDLENLPEVLRDFFGAFAETLQASVPGAETIRFSGEEVDEGVSTTMTG